MELEKQFNLLNEAINEIEAKKEELERNYSQSMEEHIAELFNHAAGGINTLSGVLEEREEKMDITEQRMQLYMNLRENFKLLFNFKVHRQN